jgi:superfamily II DNA or RNA helicase
MMRVEIGSRLVVPAADLPPEVGDELRALFTYRNPAKAALMRVNRWAARAEPDFVRTWRDELVGGEPCLTLPRGGASRLVQVARERGLPVEFVDRRQPGLPAPSSPHQIDLWPHQLRMVEACIERENCLARAVTGAGKTSMAIELVSRLGVWALVIVYDGGLFEQWVERVERELGIPRRKVGEVGRGTFALKPITIAMQQTLNRLSDEKWEKIERSFGAVICDEVQRFSCATFQRTIDRIPARYRIGISASERRKDQMEFLIYDQFGDVAVDVSSDELVDAGLVHDVEVLVWPTDFEAPWYDAQRARMRFGSEKAPDYVRLMGEVAADQARSDLAARIAADEVVAGHQVVLFCARREHCLALNQRAAARGFKSGLMLGGVDSSEEFRETVGRLRSGELRWASGTLQAVGQGLDLPSVDRGVVCSPVASNKSFWGQVRGRICRTAEGKKDAAVHYLWDHRVFGVGHLRNLVAWNNRVRVRVGDGWEDGRTYLRRMEGRDGDENEAIDGR